MWWIKFGYIPGWIQKLNCSTEGSGLFQGDQGNRGIAKVHRLHQFLTSSSPEPLGKFHGHLVQKEYKFVQMEGHISSQGKIIAMFNQGACIIK